MNADGYADELFPDVHEVVAGPTAPLPLATGGAVAADLEILCSDLADDPEMGALVEQFLLALGDRADTALRAHAVQDFVSLARIAHQLKGAAGGYGFSPIGDAAMHVEHAAHDLTASDSTVPHSSQINTLNNAMAVLLNRCRAALRGLPTSPVFGTHAERAS
jgi:chemotaxis protein histidine kinase CheA